MNLKAIAQRIVALSLVCSSAHAATVAERAFEQLRQVSLVSKEVFDFVVVADTRSLDVDKQSETFKQIIPEFNALRPSFVIDVGDIILGGAAEHLPSQWDEFERVVAPLHVPLVPVPGNHDISDAATERIWLDRVGPLAFAFTYGNSRFIALNSEEIGAVDRISDEQVAWLRGVLERTTEKHIFVFLHKPYFARDWDKNWGNVAEAIRGYPVRIVFGGDNHLYRYIGNREGVDYVISAGGGAELRVPEDEGGFHHYTLVSVRGDDVSWCLIKPGAILAKDVVTQARVDEMKSARRDWVKTESIEAPQEQPFDRSVAVSIFNPLNQPFDSELKWEVPAGWTVSPVSVAYTAAANAATRLDFKIKADNADAVRFPVPTANTVFKATQHGGPITVNRRLDLIPVYDVSRATTPVVVDGDLTEWSAAGAMRLNYAWGFDIAQTDDLQAFCRMMWDSENLYLSIETHDDEFYQPYAGDIVWSADGVQLFLADRWEWGLTLTKSGPEVFLYKGLDREGETVNTTVRLAITRDGDKTVYEAAFSKSEVTPVLFAPGNAFNFSIAANDLDPSHPERPRHWAELTPGVGDAVPSSPLAKMVLRE